MEHIQEMQKVDVHGVRRVLRYAAGGAGCKAWAAFARKLFGFRFCEEGFVGGKGRQKIEMREGEPSEPYRRRLPWKYKTGEGKSVRSVRDAKALGKGRLGAVELS